MKLTTILGAFGPHITEADGFVVPCPAHSDSKPSLRVAVADDGKLLVKCRAGCQFDEVMDAAARLGVTRSDLFDAEIDIMPQHVVGAAGATAQSVSPGMVAGLRVYLLGCAAAFADSPAERYAAERFGLDSATAHSLGLGFDDGSSAHDAAWRTHAYSGVPRLVVPFRSVEGVAKAVQGRALADDRVRWCGFRNADDGTAWAKYGWFSAGTGSAYTVICEGPSDALTAVAAGFDAIAIRGAALSAAADVLAGPLAGQAVVVAGDNDAAGEAFSEKVCAHLVGCDVRRLQLPAEVNDLNELFTTTQSLDAVAAAVTSAGAVVAAAAPAPEEPVVVVEPDPIRYMLTDLGMAERLRDAFNGDVRFTNEAGFFIFNGVVWEQDVLGVVRARHHALLHDLHAEWTATAAAARLEHDEDAEAYAVAVLKHIAGMMSTRGINAALSEMQVMPGVACSIDDFDAHSELLAFANGVVDLTTGELWPAYRELMLTRQLDFDYDPQAPCPNWERFLVDVFPNDPAMPAYLQRLVGYGVSGSSEEQCFAVLHGTGANGKSAFTETLTEVFGAITNTTPFSTFESKPSGGIPNDLAALKGARLVMASEGDANKPMAEGLLKRVTGRDQITARFMRQEYFSFRPTFLLMLASNHRPRFVGQDDGLWRRVKLISWERYFTPDERDHGIFQRLLSERQGIAAWAVRGAVQYFATGSDGRKLGLQDPQSVVAATQNYKANADALAGFFPGRLVRDDAAVEVAQDVFTAYVEHCEAEHLPHKERWTRRAFYSALEERGVQRGTSNKGVRLHGVRLVADAADLNPIGRGVS